MRGTNMKVLQEVTDWGSEKIPNHIYFIGDTGKCVGYINSLTSVKTMFISPISFNKSRRKFKDITKHVNFEA